MRQLCLSVLSSLLQLIHINILLRVLHALQSVVGRTYRVEAAPVSFAQDPWKYIHLVMELRRELGADKVGRSGTFAPRDQLHVLVVAAVLCSECGAVERQHGAHTKPCRWLVDIEALFGSAGIAPPVGLAQLLVEDVHGAVDDLGWVDAGAAGQFSQDLVEILLQEVVLAIEPLLTAVHICEGGISNSSITELGNYQKTLTYVPEISLIVKFRCFSPL